MCRCVRGGGREGERETAGTCSPSLRYCSYSVNVKRNVRVIRAAEREGDGREGER